MAYNSAYTGPQVDEAVGAVRAKASTWDDKQDKLSGTEDQIVGFNSAGEAVPVAVPNPLPSGGTAGQVLTKTADGEAWQDAPDGLPEGGAEGQVLTKTATGAQWDDVPSDLPAGGTDGQILVKTADGVAWEDKPIFIVNATSSGSGESLQISFDKTLEEVVLAHQKGYMVLATFGNVIFQLSLITSSLALFTSVFAEGDALLYVYALAMEDSGGLVIQGAIPVLPTSDEPMLLAGNVGYIQWVPASTLLTAGTITFTPGNTGLTSDNVQDAIEEVNDKVVESTSTTITLTTTGWTGSAAPFSQQVSCSIVAADTAVVAVDVDTPGTDADADAEAINAWALCTQQNPTQGAGTLTFYCTEKPTINIPVKVGVA